MKKIIVNADDFGLSKDVNEGIIYSFVHGLIDRTTLLVNMDFSGEAVILAKKYGLDRKVGLHLNIVEGRPLTEDIQSTILCDKKGDFNETTFKTLKNRLWLDKKTRNALQKEIRAQIEKYISYNLPLMHFDSHEHSHTSISVWRVLEPLLEEYNFKSVRLSRNIPESSIKGANKVYKFLLNKRIKNYNYRHGTISDKFGSQDDVSNFIKENIPYLQIEMMVHPIMCNGILKDVFNTQSLDVWLKHNYMHLKDL